MTVQPKTSIHKHLPDDGLDTLDIADLELAKPANQPGFVDTAKLIEHNPGVFFCTSPNEAVSYQP